MQDNITEEELKYGKQCMKCGVSKLVNRDNFSSAVRTTNGANSGQSKRYYNKLCLTCTRTIARNKARRAKALEIKAKPSKNPVNPYFLRRGEASYSNYTCAITNGQGVN